jgi:hypothetical protein
LDYLQAFSVHYTRIINKTRGERPTTRAQELTMIYINGKKATKADIKRLTADLKSGKQRANGHITKKGFLAITTIL